jgi:hypothetical protein
VFLTSARGVPPALDPIQVWQALPKPSHNSVAMVGAMRLLIVLVFLASTSSAMRCSRHTMRSAPEWAFRP